MIKLIYSSLINNLIKTIDPETGLYGAIDENDMLVIQPIYNELHAFNGKRAFAIRDGKLYEIDREGNEKEGITGVNTWQLLLSRKADPCPQCYHTGCELCNGMGFMPLNFRFGDID